MTTKRIDDGRDLLFADSPLGEGIAYTVEPTICANPGCDCTEMTLTVRAARRLESGVFEIADGSLARVRANAEGVLAEDSWQLGADGHELPIQWLQEQLCRDVTRQRLQERWVRVRGACGDPAYPAPQLPQELDGLVAYDEAFPHDFDMTLSVEGKPYLAVDCYCMEPTCTCDDILVQFVDIHAETAETAVAGVVRASARRFERPHVEEGGALGRSLWSALLERQGAGCLRRRFDRMRELARQRAPQPVVRTAKVGRNDPCPCGSGKKHKRCCGRS